MGPIQEALYDINQTLEDISLLLERILHALEGRWKP